MAESHALGERGEALAAAVLEAEGWRVLGRNFRSGHKEIDLVVRRDGLVAFVEVKTRASRDYGHPLEAITRAKRREIEWVARDWMRRHGRPGDSYRFDAVAIIWTKAESPQIEHVEDAWRVGGSM